MQFYDPFVSCPERPGPLGSPYCRTLPSAFIIVLSLSEFSLSACLNAEGSVCCSVCSFSPVLAAINTWVMTA